MGNYFFSNPKLNETALDHCVNSYEASITDISPKGRSLSDLPDINST